MLVLRKSRTQLQSEVLRLSEDHLLTRVCGMIVSEVNEQHYDIRVLMPILWSATWMADTMASSVEQL